MIGRPIPQGWVTMQPGFVTTAGGGPSFTNPTSISGLQVWYDFTSSTYLLNGSDVAPSDTNTIKQATDRSGNTNNATQSTDGNRPTWIADVGTGYGAALFATDNQLDFASNVALSTGAFTVFILGTRGSGIDTWLGHSNTNDAVFSASGTVVRDRKSTGTNRSFSVADMGTSGHAIFCSRTAGGDISFWVDGVPSASNPIADAGATTFSRLGVRGNTDFLDGFIGHICIYNADLTVAQKNSLGSWGAAFFGLTWTAIT